MATPITIPRLGWNMEEGTFAGWLKADGDSVRAGEVLYRLESDKSTEEIESLEGGVLRVRAELKEGDVVKVGEVIAHLIAEGETLPLAGSHLPSYRSASGSLAPVTHHVQPSRSHYDRGEPASGKASPRARRVARELGLDWTTLTGTGRNGRIRERDVRASQSTDETIPLTPIRRTIARRMHESHQTTAPVTLTTTADATNLVNLRAQFKAVGEDVPAYTDFLLKLTAISLAKHPTLNARWSESGLVLSRKIHLGLAVDTEKGLFVPVVQDVASLTLKQVAEHTRDLVRRTHEGKLQASEMQGGTFTLTNLGAFGIDAFTPIIHSPQCAILGIGRIERRPVVIDDIIVAREQITLSLTFDHRVNDGAPAARFLHTLVGLIQNPGPSLVS